MASRRRSASNIGATTQLWPAQFEHEVATAVALGIFGSVDANRG